MIFLFFIVLPLFTIWAVTNVVYQSKYGLPYRKVRQFSWPAKQILKSYHKLPKDNRPYANLPHMLKTLDSKWESKKKVDQHFAHWGYDSVIHNWNCNCSKMLHVPKKCPALEYKEINTGLKDIHSALAEQEEKLRLSNASEAIEDAKTFAAALRAERAIITETTKELI
jgi:hypothetical protein